MSAETVQAASASSAPTVTVDLAAIAHNTQVLARHTEAQIMAVVKADGFGHGAGLVARAALANGASSLGVTSIEEALALRADGIHAPILSWLNPVGADWAAALDADVELAVADREHLQAVAAVDGAARIHLHLDTGMARDGAAPASWQALCRAARRHERAGRVEVVGVMGHLACADRRDDAANAEGRSRFAWGTEVAEAAGLRPHLRHLASTAAAVTDVRTHHDLVRLGAGLVGIDPSGTVRLRPAMSVAAPLVAVRKVVAGTPVGYGHTWRAERATELGLLPLGYADGLPRAAAGRAEVLVAGRRRPVVGRISMDQTVVDLGPSSGIRVGAEATVFGPGDLGEPTAADWARWSDTIEHEIVTGLGARLRRRTVGGDAVVALRHVGGRS